MSQDEVASEAGLTRTTIVRLEQDPALVQERTRRDVRKVYEAKGIQFLFRNGVGIGITIEHPD